jgi:CrcB protein
MAALKALGPGYPYGTMAANVIGGFLMGLLAGWLALKVSGGANLWLFLGVGLLGGFTTFSAFSLDAFLMYEKKAYGSLLGYVGGSVILSIGALMIGLILARKVFGT